MIKKKDGEDYSISDFALTWAQRAAIAELETAIAKVKRLRLSLIVVDDKLFASTREKYIEDVALGAVLDGAVIAGSAQGLIERAKQNEPGLVELRSNRAVIAAKPLEIEAGVLDDAELKKARPLAGASQLPFMAAEIAKRRREGRPYRAYLLSGKVIFK